MDRIIDLISQNPVYGIVAIAIALMTVVAVIKKLIKLALVTALVFGGYVIYMHVQGQDVSSPGAMADHLREKTAEAGQQLKEVGGELGKEVTKHLQDVAREELDKKLRDSLSP